MNMKNNKYLIIFTIAVAILIKSFLFGFAVAHAPNSKIEEDSRGYLQTATFLYSQGVFSRYDDTGVVRHEVFRTPGYPVFIVFLRDLMKIPLNGIIFIQVFLTVLTALITYKAAIRIDRRIGILSAVIVLYDPPVSIFSLMLMTEALFLFLMALFMYAFTLYLKSGRIKYIVLSGLILVAATYVRPISYYLSGGIAIFIIYANIRKDFRKTFIHALAFLVLAYSLMGIWQIRNYKCCGVKSFSTVGDVNNQKFALFRSYSRNNDPATKGMAPAPYYANVTFRCFLSLMTRPGSFKYFKSGTLNIIGKILAYPWMIFWMAGFLIGIIKTKRNIYYQFMLLVILYFITVTIVNVMWISGERLRIPIVPYIAIISAYGWSGILARLSYRRFSGQAL